VCYFQSCIGRQFVYTMQVNMPNLTNSDVRQAM
jgi:hypothetical protein